MLRNNRAFHDDMFIYNFRIDDLIDKEHFFCKVKKYIDFSFVREEVKHLYSHTGRPSVDPVMLFKLLFLIFCEKIHSEPQAMKQVKYNFLYRWFLDLKVDDELPNHNAFTRLRQRLGVKPFERFLDSIFKEQFWANPQKWLFEPAKTLEKPVLEQPH